MHSDARFEAGVEFLDENGGSPGVRLRKSKKTLRAPSAGNEAGWAVPWHLGFRIGGLLAEPRLLECVLLHAPIGLFAVDIGEHREVEVRRRGRCRPFE